MLRQGLSLEPGAYQLGWIACLGNSGDPSVSASLGMVIQRCTHAPLLTWMLDSEHAYMLTCLQSNQFTAEAWPQPQLCTLLFVVNVSKIVLAPGKLLWRGQMSSRLSCIDSKLYFRKSSEKEDVRKRCCRVRKQGKST